MTDTTITEETPLRLAVAAEMAFPGGGMSLKTFLQGVAIQTGWSMHTLYEHQRALVRRGLLKNGNSRGTGNGVRATPEAITIFFITFAASLRPSDMAILEKSVTQSSTSSTPKTKRRS